MFSTTGFVQEILQKKFGDMVLENCPLLSGIADFYIPKHQIVVICYEESHDHPDAYFGRHDYVLKLQAKGYHALFLWIENLPPEEQETSLKKKIANFLTDI